MLFNSYIYILLFLPLTFGGYYLLNGYGMARAALGWLVAASVFFYGWWNPAYVPLILASLVVNYALGVRLSGRRAALGLRGRPLLAAGIAANVLLLCYYKYTDFFIGNVNAALGLSLPLQHIVLPLALSFFTFQQIAYLVDSHRGLTREYDFLNYALFVTFFPQLIAGPIVHHSEMMPQYARPRSRIMSQRNIARGVLLFSIGLFKKVLIADTFGVWSTAGFDGGEALSFFRAWGTSLSYTMQLYFDFSGYVDMAMGSALLFNIRLPRNFNSPYRALDIQDFWRRWHMTLSRFLRDYIYFPLGGSRGGGLRTACNLMLTFLIGGLWHGAGWTFVFWGFLHGAALVAHRLWKLAGGRLPRWAAWAATFGFVNVAWVFFRAQTWADALRVLRGMIGVNGVAVYRSLYPALDFLPFVHDSGVPLVAGGAFWVAALGALPLLVWKESHELAEGFRPTVRYAALASACAVMGLAAMQTTVSEFLYFNF